jgi:prepilin-type N-terminal cleavage/methylation domain-containing protein
MKKILHKGFSLPELMVSMALLAILFGICILLFLSSWQRFQITGIMQEVQNSALMGIDRFSRDFNETDLSSVHNSADQNYDIKERYIYFRTARNREGRYVSSPSGIEWQGYFYYFLLRDTSNTTAIRYNLMRTRFETEPLGITPDHISGSPDTVALTRNIIDFHIEGGAAYYRVHLETSLLYKGRKCTFAIDREYFLKDLPD